MQIAHYFYTFCLDKLKNISVLAISLLSPYSVTKILLKTYLCLFVSMGSVGFSFGQKVAKPDSLKWHRHDISINLATLISPNGQGVQIGYTYELAKQLGLGVELGFLGQPIFDDNWALPHKAYSGIQLRPHLQWYTRKYKTDRAFWGLMYRHQHILFRDRRFFFIDEGNGYLQNISYSGKQIINAIYITNGGRYDFGRGITMGLTWGLGWVRMQYKQDKPLPSNITQPLTDTILFFAERDNNYENRTSNKLGLIIDLKIGYTF